MPKRNILLAMFDIKPVAKPGEVSVEKLDEKPSNINLAEPQKELKPWPRFSQVKTATPVKTEKKNLAKAPEPQQESLAPAPVVKNGNPQTREKIINELEQMLIAPVDVAAELTSIGGQVHPQTYLRPQPRQIFKKVKSETAEIPAAKLPESGKAIETFWKKPAETVTKTEKSKMPMPIAPSRAQQPPKVYNVSSPASREVDIWLENLKKNRGVLARVKTQTHVRAFPKKFQFVGKFKNISPSALLGSIRRSLFYLAGFAVLFFVIFSLVKSNGIGVKNNLTDNGDHAIASLEDAKQKLENLDFTDAADSFALAYDDFNKASQTLNQLGSSFVSLFGNLPGLGKLKAASNLIEAGQSLSKAGENLSLAFATIYKTNPFSFLESSGANQASVSKLLSEFKDVLVFADKNIKKANSLLASIDNSVIPDDKQQLFTDFKEKIPEFQQYIGEAIDYSDFLLKFVGNKGTKTYLVLLQNNNELRATGGFPGTYALLTFDGGYLKKIFVDDIYQLDAGSKENIIPPVQLQHITPTWGIRDANWFADFPTSAKKIEEMYKIDGGSQIDGVLTITPDVIMKMLDVVGPIDMPEYSMKLDSSNFLDQVQSEVEYKADRAKPKKIISDLEPKFLGKLGQQDKDHWLQIFKILLVATQEKHILAYFNDPELENVAQKNNFAGDTKNSNGDYLQVVYTNVKGSKTDFVTDNSASLKVVAKDDGTFEHTLSISRNHNGGGSKYGFYNRDNPAYIRIYAPAGSTLESITGNSITDFKPLVDYSSGFQKDADLGLLEQNTSRPFSGVDVSEESDKTVFGFWLVVKPQEKKSVVVKYKTPAGVTDANKYSLLWQKQSGTDKDPIIFNFQLPDNKKAVNVSDDLQTIGNSLVLNSDLSVDREISTGF